MKLGLRLLQRACWQAAAGVSEAILQRSGNYLLYSDAALGRCGLFWAEKHCWQDANRTVNRYHPCSFLQLCMPFWCPLARIQQVTAGKAAPQLSRDSGFETQRQYFNNWHKTLSEVHARLLCLPPVKCPSCSFLRMLYHS